MNNLNDFRQLVAMWMNSDKNPDRAALSLWKYMQPRTIETAEQLEALPNGAVLMSAGRTVWEKTADDWYMVGDDAAFIPQAVVLPATVLHEPNA